MPSSTKFATRRPRVFAATPAPQDPQTAHSAPAGGPLRSARLLLAAFVLIGALAACSSNDDASSGVSAGHNAGDVTFATNMIPHHAQAIEMSDMAVSRASSTELVDLAKAIKKAQRPEIDAMAGWLKAWGEPVPDAGSIDRMEHAMPGHGGKSGMDGMDGMDGMMSAADLERLGSRAGRSFDTMWLTMMIEHHEGAIEMARTEIADGTSGAVISLAQDIKTAQQAEIETMHRLLDTIAD